MTFISGFFRHPRQVALRRIAFQVHLWMGLLLGLYMLVMSLTGVSLLFQEEVEAAAQPGLFHVAKASGPRVDVDTLIAAVRAKYPNNKVWRIYPPTTRRDTFLISVEDTGGFRTLFAHPTTGAILGELPRGGFLASVWSVHANLASGDPGRLVNCTLGLVVLLLFLTGLIVWWPGVARWWRALGVNGREPGLRVLRRLHGAVGIWAFLFLVMFATTGAMYYYGPTFFRLLGPVSARSEPPSVWSDPGLEGKGPRPTPGQLVTQAEAASPGKGLWALLPPMSAKSPVVVIVGPVADDLGRHVWDWDTPELRHVYFDQYDGRVLARWDMAHRSFADIVRAWIAPLHRGSFGGIAVKAVWTLIGLAPAALFVLGVILWWTRVVRPRPVAATG